MNFQNLAILTALGCFALAVIWAIFPYAHTYTRRDVLDRVLSTHTNLWVVTKVAGEWGIAVRSY